MSAVGEVTKDTDVDVTTADSLDADGNCLPYSAFLREISFRDLGCTTRLGGTCHCCSLPVDDVSAGDETVSFDCNKIISWNMASVRIPNKIVCKVSLGLQTLMIECFVA